MPEAKDTPQRRYDRVNCVQVMMKLNRSTDADLLEKLASVPNKQGYIKNLIRRDIEQNEK